MPSLDHACFFPPGRINDIDVKILRKYCVLGDRFDYGKTYNHSTSRNYMTVAGSSVPSAEIEMYPSSIAR